MSDNCPQLHLENQLCFPLYAASRLTTKIYAPYLKEMDITYPQYLVMLVLWQNGNQSLKAIGERLYLESNTLTPLIKRLEQKELVKRKRSTKDERAVVISLTQRGKELKDQAKDIPNKISEAFKESAFEELELKEFQKTLFNLLEMLNKYDK